MQINKYISNAGFCSRREAEKLIEQTRVTINDELCLLSSRVYPGDEVAVDGERLKSKQKAIYIALNKPVGVTSTTDLSDKSNVISFMNHPKRIFPVGRLDKDSEGLILLTNDGDIVNKILRAGNNNEKEYVVTVDQELKPEMIRQMGVGVKILGERTKPCYIRQESARRFRIILKQGLNRQIRRMCAEFGYKVKSLKRIRIMHIALGNLATGKWRYLSPVEIDQLEKTLLYASN
ncbi:MAG: 23S rRNA pseudouridine synthase F [Chitinophagaceae bacterium]|nr:MAG: 23S rRNA pseudouridine synthase F [Chitinophagaceae bacterium]